MDFLISLSILSLAAFIYYDATKNGIGKIQGETGAFNLHAGGWALCSILLAIIAIPAYFIKRKTLIEKAKINPISASGRNAKLLVLLALPILFLISGLSQTQVTSSSSNSGNYKQIDFADFLVDFDQYRNQQVVVSGVLLPQDDSSAFFYEEVGSTNTLYLATGKLSNEEKKEILRECKTGCEASLILTPAVILGSKGAIVQGINR